MPDLRLADAYALALAHHQAGRLDRAEPIYRAIVQADPTHADAAHALGMIAYRTGRPAEAVAWIEQALALRPGTAAYYANLCPALTAVGRHADALAAGRQAIALGPHLASAHYNLGLAHAAAGDPASAEACYRAALALQPGFADAHNNLGNTLRKADRLDEALAHYRAAIRADPTHADAYSNLGSALVAAGRPREAIAFCQSAVALQRRHADGHWNLALACLTLGDFDRGWPAYEFRWWCKDLKRPWWNYRQPQWRGEPLAGRTILVHTEQGAGDIFQFVRYLPLLADRGATVVLSYDRELAAVLRGVAGVAVRLGPGEDPPPFDFYCPLLSLPLAFGTRLETIPATVPYLSADPPRVADWAARLATLGPGRRIGLCWAGRPDHHNDRHRSLPLAALAPLADVPGVRWVSLQVGPAAAQVADAEARFPLADWSADLRDYADTAALVANLDLVISVDTSVAHLAGALARPVWVLLPHVADWRWLQDRPDSPWYPTARLFRQPARGDWPAVVAALRAALGQLQLLV